MTQLLYGALRIAPAPGGRVGCDPDLRSGKGDFQ